MLLAGLLLLASIASFGLGAYLAGVLRPTLGATTPHEVEFRDGVHGLLAWGIAILIATALTRDDRNECAAVRRRGAYCL
jgi:ABC-type branched-subunit amino acid transport system permease subunit